MRIYRETIGSKDLKKDLIFGNATQADWDKLITRSMSKAKLSEVGFQLPKFYPESIYAFSVVLKTGKKYRFNRVC